MVDVLLVNPPSPNKSVIIRDFNRSGRTTKERIIWPADKPSLHGSHAAEDFVCGDPGLHCRVG